MPVAGEESYVLLVRVASPRHLEQLLQEIRATANVRTRSTIIPLLQETAPNVRRELSAESHAGS